jgi:hypothetical protein
MKAVNRFIMKNKSVHDELNQCSCHQHSTIPKMSQWQNHLSGRYHNFIEASGCPKESHPNLAYGVGSTSTTPKLLNWKCVRNECNNCGIEKKLLLTTCPVLMNCTRDIPLMEWTYARRAGF